MVALSAAPVARCLSYAPRLFEPKALAPVFSAVAEALAGRLFQRLAGTHDVDLGLGAAERDHERLDGALVGLLHEVEADVAVLRGPFA